MTGPSTSTTSSSAGVTATSSKTSTSITTLPDGPASEFNDEYGREHSSMHSLHNDEEPAVIGWGGDEEDGMGML
jgi:hypothetical protein